MCFIINRHEWRKIYAHIYAGTHRLIFKKTCFCEVWHYFLVLKNKPIETKIIPFSGKYVQRKGFPTFSGSIEIKHWAKMIWK